MSYWTGRKKTFNFRFSMSVISDVPILDSLMSSPLPQAFAIFLLSTLLFPAVRSGKICGVRPPSQLNGHSIIICQSLGLNKRMHFKPSPRSLKPRSFLRQNFTSRFWLTSNCRMLLEIQCQRFVRKFDNIIFTASVSWRIRF